MTLKIELAKGEFKGQLEQTKQEYIINYLPIVKEEDKIIYCDKIEFALITPAKDKNDTSYHSLRFIDPTQLRILIIDLLKGYVKFKKERGELTEFNEGYIEYDISKEIKKIVTSVIRGEYDFS